MHRILPTVLARRAWPVAGNLVPNGGFDLDLQRWTAGAGILGVRSRDIFTGGGALLTANGAASSWLISDVINVSAGARYRLSCLAFTPASNPGLNVATLGIQSGSFTAAGTVAAGARNTVQRLTLDFTAALSTLNVYLSVVASDFSAWGTNGAFAHFDNVSLVRI